MSKFESNIDTSIDAADEAQQPPPRVYAEDLPEALVDGVAQFLGRPRARGWIHVYSAVVAFIAGAALVSVSWSVESTRAGLATLLYTFTIVAMFAVSGTYHRVTWKSPTARKWMKRLDHSMIFVFIAGSYTPFALLALPSKSGWVLFWIVWAGAIAGVLLKLRWPSAADRRRRAVQHRRRALRAEVAQPVADDIWTSRVLSRMYGGRGDLPLHRDVVRGLLVAISAHFSVLTPD